MVKAAFMFTPADIHSGPHTVQPLQAPFTPLCLAFSGSIRFVRACLGQVCPAPSNMAQDAESFAELVARLQVSGPEPDMEAMENTGTSPVATDAAEEDKAAKAEEEMADATETEVAPAGAGERPGRKPAGAGGRPGRKPAGAGGRLGVERRPMGLVYGQAGVGLAEKPMGLA